MPGKMSFQYWERVAGQTLLCLQAGSYRSKYAIAKAMGAAESSVRRAVDRLMNHGLAFYSQAEHLYYADPVSSDKLRALSIRLHANGRAEMKRIKHEIEREIFLTKNLAKTMSAYNE